MARKAGVNCSAVCPYTPTWVSRTMSSRVVAVMRRATVSNRPTRMRSWRNCRPMSLRASQPARPWLQLRLALRP